MERLMLPEFVLTDIRCIAIVGVITFFIKSLSSNRITTSSQHVREYYLVPEYRLQNTVFRNFLNC
mgnify:CR=1 FL=1